MLEFTESEHKSTTTSNIVFEALLDKWLLKFVLWTKSDTQKKEHSFDIMLRLCYLLSVDYQKAISTAALGRHGQTLHDSAVLFSGNQ